MTNGGVRRHGYEQSVNHEKAEGKQNEFRTEKKIRT